jgi:hypothetical protein
MKIYPKDNLWIAEYKDKSISTYSRNLAIYWGLLEFFYKKI